MGTYHLTVIPNRFSDAISIEGKKFQISKGYTHMDYKSGGQSLQNFKVMNGVVNHDLTLQGNPHKLKDLS